MDKLVQFMRARLNEEAAGATGRALAEVEVKRSTLDDYIKEASVMEQGHRTGWTEGGQAVRKQLIRAWVAMYRDHPDFDPALLES